MDLEYKTNRKRTFIGEVLGWVGLISCVLGSYMLGGYIVSSSTHTTEKTVIFLVPLGMLVFGGITAIFSNFICHPAANETEAIARKKEVQSILYSIAARSIYIFGLIMIFSISALVLLVLNKDAEKVFFIAAAPLSSLAYYSFKLSKYVNTMKASLVQKRNFNPT